MAVALESVVKQLTDSGIIAPGKLESFMPPKASPKDGEELLRELFKQNLLTKFQAQQVAAGKAKALILGNYMLLDKIGAGGMGQVFKAKHRRLERLVAIKMLPPAMTKDAAAVARFQREVKAAAKLRHPNIVATDDADEANGAHFLVMECVEGQDLSALVKKNGPFPVAKAVNCILQAARGLEFAHGEGVIHRDIKPSNLLLDKKGTVKILEMGLARIASDGNAATQAELTGSGAVMGTIDYMAPEQALNTKTADARADIYSLGCSLFYLLTGKATFEGETLTAKLLAHQTQPIPELRAIRPEVPEEVEAVFRKMLAKKVEDRYQTMTEVIADLERCATGQSPSLGSQPLASTNANNTLTFNQDVLAQPTLPKATATKKAPVTKSAGGKNKKFIYRAVGAACLGALLLAAIVFFVQTSDGAIRVEINDPEIVVAIQGTDIVLKQADNGTDVRLTPGGKTLLVQRGDFRFETDKLILKRGETVTVDVTLLAGTVEVRQGERLLGSQEIPSSPAIKPRPSVAGGWHGWPADAPKPAIAPFDAEQAKQHQDAWAAYLNVPVEWENSIGMKFRLIPPGEFLMGSTRDEFKTEEDPDAKDPQSLAFLAKESPQHRVVLTKPFFLGTTEVTQGEFKAVMGVNPVYFRRRSQFPVGDVNWNDASGFCRQLGAIEGLPEFSIEEGRLVANGYCLPAEAEWEFACRAGTTTRFWTGDDFTSLLQSAWFRANADTTLHDVGTAYANPLGLYDMLGNAWEWVLDGWHSYSRYANGTVVDPHGPFLWAERICRGGDRNSTPLTCRSAHRVQIRNEVLTALIGFRVTIAVDAVRKLHQQPKLVHSEGSWTGWPADAPAPAIASFDAAAAKAHQEAWARHLGVPVEFSHPLGFRFRLIPPGEYTKGRATGGGGTDEAPRLVRITRPFYAAVHEMTVAQCREWVEKTGHRGDPPEFAQRSGFDSERGELVINSKFDWRNPGFRQEDYHPAVCISFRDICFFCSWMSSQGLGKYRFPTEAEWEFLARAGASEDELKQFEGPELVQWGNVADATLKGQVPAWKGTDTIPQNDGFAFTCPVGKFRANAFGLFDVVGNVSEWCHDWEGPIIHGEHAENDPQGPDAGSMKVARGSAWNTSDSLEQRLAILSERGQCQIGFRVVLNYSPELKRAFTSANPTETERATRLVPVSPSNAKPDSPTSTKAAD